MPAQRVAAARLCEDHTSVKHPHLFEISAWPWLERLSAREHRRVALADVPRAEWDAIAARGFTHLFLMGVWTRSPFGRAIALEHAGLRKEYDDALPGWTADDVAGSPYCIQAYEPDARMGGWDGLAAARRELNRRGIALLLDFVPNHTAFDHRWVTEHPERYVLGQEDDLRFSPDAFRRAGGAIIACGRDPYFPPWTDVAQLNYFNPATREAMARELAAIAAHCDGLRCDMAMLVLNDVFERTWRPVLRERWSAPSAEFWPSARAAAPDTLLVAEVYWDLEWTLQQQGFSFTYDKRLLDRLRGSTPEDVRGHLRAEAAYRDRLARFIENHDEPRSAATLGPRLPAAAVLLATLPGMRFYFDGQLEGRRLRSPVQLGRWHDEPLDSTTQDLYGRLLRATASPLFHDGEWRLLEVAPAADSSFGDLIAYRWRHAAQLALVVVNLGDAEASGYVPVGAELPPGESVGVADLLTGTKRRVPRRSLDVRGLFVRLPPGGAHLLEVG